MSKFKAAVMTDAGAELLAKSMAEGFRLEFVKMVTGSGIYEEDEKTTTELRRRTELKNRQQEIGFSNVTAVEGNAVKLKALITNEKLETGYRLTEIGIIAKKEDSEILYSIAIAEEADFLPSKENPIEIIQEYYTRVSNAENVYISAKMGAVALVEDLDATYQKAAGYTDQKITDLIGGAPETLDTLKEVADAIEENEDVVSALNAAIGNKANQTELDTHIGNGTIHITATERENWNLCGAEKDLMGGKTNIEYSYPDIESDSIIVNSGAESLTAAVKDSTQKLSETAIEIRQKYLTKTGNSANNTVGFASADNTNPTAWTNVSVVASGEKHSGLFSKISMMFKNVRYLYKMLGTTDISQIGDGTMTGALSSLNANSLKCKVVSASIAGIAAGSYKIIELDLGLTGTNTLSAAIPYLQHHSYQQMEAKLISATANSVTFRVNNNSNAATSDGVLHIAILYK